MNQRGFTLLEVLIALAILSIGLLAMGQMQLLTLRNSNGSGLRGQAVLVAEDMANRLYANSPGADAGRYLLAVTDTLPTSAPSNLCTTSTCSAAEMATADRYQWATLARSKLPGFKASIVCSNGDLAAPTTTCDIASLHTITVMWDEPDGLNGTGTGCGPDPNVDLLCYRLSVDP